MPITMMLAATASCGAKLAFRSWNIRLRIGMKTMTASWHPDSDATPTPQDVTVMVETLEGQHGPHAVGIAEFFATLHALKGDAGRSWAWAGVAEAVRRRAEARAKLH
jgi:hypothetical protein